MKKIALFFSVIISGILNAQTPIEVYQSTIKISSVDEHILHFGFLEGDKIVFNFKEVNGKELKEVEIQEYPSISKFMEYKAVLIPNKTITVQQTGIYSFRFTNSALTGRICSIKIERIPKDESSANFNTNVYWKTVSDSLINTIQEEYITSSDTTYVDFYSATPQISSQNAINGNKPSQVVSFDLPENTVAWSFYLGTGNESKIEYERARTAFFNAVGKTMATIPGYGPMAYLALTGMSYMNKVQGADNVKYYFLSSSNDVQLFNSGQSFYQYKSGDVINEAFQMKAPLKGRIYLGLVNDNTIDVIQVTIKATAVCVKHNYSTRPKQIITVTQHKEPYLK